MPQAHFSLRQVLTIPYVLLTLAVAGIIGGLSYVAGGQAVSGVSEELLRDMASRISQAVDRHLVGSRVVLDAVFPDGMIAPKALDAEKDNLRDRMWIAASLNPDPNNYVYYGNREGRFAGVVRNPDGSGEWRSGQGADTPRSLARFAGLGAPLQTPTLELRLYNPRERPWYKRAVEAGKPAWSPVYVDNRTGELVATRAKPVRDAKGEIEGVAATDVSLKALNDFVRALRVSENGVAFVAERNGDLIASSSDDSMRLSNGQQTRLNASQSENELVRAAYSQFAARFSNGMSNGRDAGERGQTGGKGREAPQSAGSEPQVTVFDTAQGKIYASANVIRDSAGLEWITVVAVPRSDFMAGVMKNVTRTAIIAVGAALLAIALGLWVLNWVSHDLRLLSTAARRLGEGHLYKPVGIARQDELGELARNFEAMHISLQTDKLTDVFNRDTFEKQLARRIEEHRTSTRPHSFAILFIDLDYFKKVNDEMGHQVGDTVLQEIAGRLKHSLRSGDIVGRYGGDEFVVLLHEIENAQAADLVRDKIRQRMSEPLASLADSIHARRHVTASIGLAIYPDDGSDGESLIFAADQEMYEHKFSGRPKLVRS
ncbi:MAG: GGDEF domain-containing protein [Betaproteobacteria bacterium]